jgi:hypothetical protein
MVLMARFASAEAGEPSSYASEMMAPSRLMPTRGCSRQDPHDGKGYDWRNGSRKKHAPIVSAVGENDAVNAPARDSAMAVSSLGIPASRRLSSEPGTAG